MHRKLLNKIRYISFFCVVILLFNACESSKQISVTDDSSLVSSRKEFFDNLYKSISLKENNIDSYLSKKMSISSNDIPIYNSLNASLYISNDTLISKAYLPFPVIEVGKVMISDGFMFFESKVANKNEIKTFPDNMLPLIKSSILGSVPKAYNYFGDDDFSKFNLFIEKNKYVLYRKDDFVEVKIIVNSDMTLSELYANYSGMSMFFTCTNYDTFDSYLLPKTMNLGIYNGNTKFDFKINIRNITLNSLVKLEY